jgi:hypothetical protein
MQSALTEQQLEQQALDLVNQGREALGLRRLASLPRANRANSMGCVTFNSFREANLKSAGGTCLEFRDRDPMLKLSDVWGTVRYGQVTVELPELLQEVSGGDHSTAIGRDESIWESDRWAFLHDPYAPELVPLDYDEDDFDDSEED